MTDLEDWGYHDPEATPLPPSDMSGLMEEMIFNKEHHLIYKLEGETLIVTLSKDYRDQSIKAEREFYTGTPAVDILDWVQAVLYKFNMREV